MDYKKIIRSRAARENILRALAFIPDEAMLRIQYRIKTGRALHLKHPTRFTEKLQWYKLYYRDPDMLRCVDKYEVRAYLRERGFQDLLPRCFGVFDSPDQLPVPQLPDRFVLKDTLGSGGNAVLLCPDKDRADWRAIRKTAAGWCATPLVRDGGREWPYYSGKPHRILAEEYLQMAAGPLTDYKFFCFGGKCAFVYVCTGRHNGSAVEIHIVSPSYEKLPVVRVGDEPSDRLPDRPESFGEMVRLAEAISAPFPPPTCGQPAVPVRMWTSSSMETVCSSSWAPAKTIPCPGFGTAHGTATATMSGGCMWTAASRIWTAGSPIPAGT